MTRFRVFNTVVVV